MNKEQRELFKFYCWQIGINSLAQLEVVKQETNSNSSEELLKNLQIIYNRI